MSEVIRRSFLLVRRLKKNAVKISFLNSQQSYVRITTVLNYTSERKTFPASVAVHAFAGNPNSNKKRLKFHQQRKAIRTIRMIYLHCRKIHPTKRVIYHCSPFH